MIKISVPTTPIALMYAAVCFFTSMIGYTIHKDVFWSIVDFIFTPIAWGKWFVYHQVSLSVIKKTFEFFFQ